MKSYSETFTYEDKYGRKTRIKLDKLEHYVRRFGPRNAADVYMRAYGLRPMNMQHYQQTIDNAIAYLRRQYIYKALIGELNAIQNTYDKTRIRNIARKKQLPV